MSKRTKSLTAQMLFRPLRIPPYAPMTEGAWTLTREDPLPIVRGYFRGLQPWRTDNWVLRKNKRIWMSLSPMELESQAHHAVEAYGTVVIMGFGMGALAWNVAQRAAVRKIIVVEKDPDVVALAARLIALPGWETVTEKMFVHQEDALEFKGAADVVLADIWPNLGDMALRPDLQRIASNVKATKYAAWGLELDFISWCQEQHVRPDRIRGEHWVQYALSLGVPLIMSKTGPEAAVIAEAARIAALNVINY